MYQPPAFREDRVEIMQDLMHTQPFATLICAGLVHGLDGEESAAAAQLAAITLK